MLPSHTVENYLKAIFQAQSALSGQEALVPMGQLAAALGVVPGTATTMVKALAESGLVRYEPYVGVRLTPAGEKLAALVLRRHRLIELFLVKVMGMSWTEVHDEAEHLEHAVSDRLIERIDEMLGRPSVDPHGDPIPGPEGTLDRHDYDTLLTCPLGSAVTVSRVSDQDSEFLRFIERHDLKPGEVVRVEERDSAADSVRLRGRGEREITIGARAASKVLVQAVRVLAAVLLTGALAHAQVAPPAKPAAEPFQIADNSFLIEEAYNQDAGVFQNIVGGVRADRAWTFAFTQEWPVVTDRHQFSYSLAVVEAGRNFGFGDILLNYRYQVSHEGPGTAAVATRVSVILPSGDADRGFGDGSGGVQVNLPVSKQHGDWQWNWNGGLTWLRGIAIEQTPLARRREATLSPFVGGSAVYRARRMLYLMLESMLDLPELPAAGGTSREAFFTLSPGVRGGWNLGDHQLVLGLAVPVTWHDRSDTGAFLYASYELPFGR
jgi:DtxR family Mn-dependent transcriptional regulator